MEERWMCTGCGAEFPRPVRRAGPEDGFRLTVERLCPRCGAPAEELEPCPACAGGWRQPGQAVCHKCRLRLVGELGRFARSFTPPELTALDDALDGASLTLAAAGGVG